jgi:hypothetical protein
MIEFLDRPIAFHRSFIELGVGVTGALLLSQALYWSKRTKHADKWFYKTQKEWTDETGMSRREIETARKKLRQLNILEEKKQGVPCKVFYRINEANLVGALEQTSMAESDNLECAEVAKPDVASRQTITEITQRLPKTTAERVVLTTLPDDFVVSSDMVDWFQAQGYEFDMMSATQQWAEAMRAKGTKYQDWVSGWKMGMRAAHSYHQGSGQRTNKRHANQLQQPIEQSGFGLPKGYLDHE